MRACDPSWYSPGPIPAPLRTRLSEVLKRWRAVGWKRPQTRPRTELSNLCYCTSYGISNRPRQHWFILPAQLFVSMHSQWQTFNQRENFIYLWSQKSVNRNCVHILNSLTKSLSYISEVSIIFSKLKENTLGWTLKYCKNHFQKKKKFQLMRVKPCSATITTSEQLSLSHIFNFNSCWRRRWINEHPMKWLR